MPKYIRFEQGNNIDGKPAYRVINKKVGDLIGAVLWHPPWRRYILQCAPETIWADDCLADVEEFIKSLAKPVPVPMREPGED